jgi:hypothetical protein
VNRSHVDAVDLGGRERHRWLDERREQIARLQG